MTSSRILLIFIALMTLAACNDSSNHTTPAAANTPTAVPAPPPAPKKVALVMKTLTNPFFIEMEKGARRAGKEFGIDLQVKTGSQETAIEQQIQIIDELIQAKVDAIVIAPGDSQRLVPILKKAQNSGIVIINIDNQLDPNVQKNEQMKPVPFVSVDNEAASYQSAKFIAGQVSKPSQAAIIEGIRGAENARLRMVGAARAFSENPNIHVVAKETADWKIDEAHDVTRRLFASHPDINLLFCANDMMALGALRYLQESGHKNVLVAGYDALDEAKSAIKKGTMAATIDQQAAEQGYQGVALAVRALHGETLPGIVMVEAHLVTAKLLK